MAYYSRRRGGYNSGYSGYSKKNRGYSGYRRGRRSYSRRTGKKTSSWKGKKSGGRRAATGSTMRSLKAEVAKMALTQSHGTPHSVELTGLPRELAVRGWGDTIGKYYFAVPVTDVMVSALVGTGKQSLWTKGVSLDLDLYHGSAVDFFAVLVAMPVGTHALSVGLNASERIFTMVKFGEEGGDSKENAGDFLDGQDQTVTTLGDAVFGKVGRDETYFTSSVEAGRSHSGSVTVNGKTMTQTGKVSKKFGVGANVSLRDPSTFSKETVHVWWNYEKLVPVIDCKGYPVEKYYAVLCGVRPQVGVPFTTPVRDKSGQVVDHTVGVLGWLKNVKSSLYYRL